MAKVGLQCSRPAEMAIWRSVSGLFEVGAAADIHNADYFGVTPMRVTCEYRRRRVSIWLILNGALNNVTSGHVDPVIVQRDINFSDPYATTLLMWTAETLHVHATFFDVVLRASVIVVKRKKSPRRQCFLTRLPRGVLQHLANSLGVETQRRLRNVRELNDTLLPLVNFDANHNHLE